MSAPEDRPKETKKHIIVVGAGVGGVAVAARLARAGHQVTVVEKNANCGGRCSVFTRKGFRFDVGPSLYLMPDIFKETFADLGEDISTHIELIKCNPNYKLYFADNDTITLSSDLTQLKSEIDRVEPKTGWPGFLRFLKEGQSHYDKSVALVLRKNFEMWYEFFTGDNLISAFELHVLWSMWGRASRYFKSDKLRRAFTFQAMYMGQSPYEAPGTYNLLQYTEIAEGVWYPKGGFNIVIEKMEMIAITKGAKFMYNTSAKRIIVDKEARLATGIELDDGRVIDADVVVCNADLVWAYNNLLQPTSYSKSLTRKAHTSSTFSFYWGMKQTIPELNAHNIFLAADYKESFDRIFKDQDLPIEPSFYIHVPSRVDSTAAPAGKDVVTVLVPVGHISASKKQDWPALQKRARAAVISLLEAKLGIKDFASLIEVEEVNNPESWRDTYNLHQGSALGLSHNITQVGWFRPSTRHEDIGNIFFVGASTHPGTGVPVVLYSARLVARQVRLQIMYGLKWRVKANYVELLFGVFCLLLAVLAAIYMPKDWALLSDIEPEL
ncbi:hypothetical protein SmJEL517_g02419 [Synchytrium microbalum]|uniref:Phytoene desaturase n=1 Tax=Synchytrium microbalum TaxID=1806994 RepID=A0A507C1Y1_9FUNG|nr:uncharacterized protein SmJEL517_g02419 [Synchytrium microbalum]TPX35127.1 hypothetical protein SmJEL517_g02419 [Synchytrium microbalum]